MRHFVVGVTIFCAVLVLAALSLAAWLLSGVYRSVTQRMGGRAPESTTQPTANFPR
jgi:hypothetical protein